MLLKLLFWLFVALDAAAIGLVFVLGLAAAGSSRTQPLAVTLMLLVVPGAMLAAAIWLHQRTASPWLRLLAFALVSAPAAALVIGRLAAEFSASSNPGGIWGETELTRALRELEKDPGQLATVRTLLAGGADPNEPGEQLPLVLAIYAVRHVGQEPLRLLLDRGADPNRQDQFGRPCWFAATGITVDLAVLQLLLDRGADPQARSRDGHGGAWGAVACDNWAAARLLVQRGCPVDGRSPMGTPLQEKLEGYVRQGGPRGTGAATVLAEIQKRK
ncbi:MAG: hypothetical protein MUC36_11715 [Planctomycetes bacterium]|jgi:hypothetical protein|nr:hypothetical protein [Planctomycetota bacterium]